MREDKPLVSPSLLELSACVVAQNESVNLFHKQYLIDNECSEKTSAIQLPINCVENIMKCVCNELRQKQQTSLYKSENDKLTETSTKMLFPFFKTHHYPISKLDLSGIYLTDQLLANFLIAQQRTLTCLNLSFVKGITSSGVCSLLFESNAQLIKLKSLKLTSADLLRVPKFRRNNVRYIQNNSLPNREIDLVNFHLSSLPVVSEDDLSGTLSSNSGGRSGASIMNRKSSGFSASDGFSYYTETVPHFMTFCPSIYHLYLVQENSFNIEDEQQGIFLVRVLEGVKENLQTLDLSEWQNFHQFLNGITVLTKLTTLVLYDVQYLENSIGIIKEIKTITSLDLSQSERSTGHYTRPVTALHSLVTSLANLKFLDISGTNLISACSDDDRPFRGTGLIASDIPGLSYLRQPLKYLGIFSCDNAPHFQNIPAEKVCGDHGEDQILLALEVYMERPKMMQAVLNESYQLYRFGNNLARHVEALHLVLRALALHKLNSSLQIAGSASMFYIIRKVHMNRDTKRSVISALVNGMENHKEEQVMVRNCCLSLCQFEIPHEIMFNYGRVASLLVRVLETHNSDQLTQRIVVFLLNSMACHVEGDQKIEVGNIGAIEVILEQIRRKHSLGTCDDVMEVGWSFLWNITDETPTNCNRFLIAKGLELFQICYSQFSNETELVRNMMGLIGNIAEVEALRYQLMNVNYINIFVHLLTHLIDGIEISYNSAGVLAHLVSDGEEVWLQYVGPSLSRLTVMNQIINATKSWNLSARRYINYRSFKPILKLLPMFDSSGSQHWAVWALANLTSTDMHKYCRYVQDEGGESLLHDLVTDERTPDCVRKLASLVISNIQKWRDSIKYNNNGIQDLNLDAEMSVHLDLVD